MSASCGTLGVLCRWNKKAGLSFRGKKSGELFPGGGPFWDEVASNQLVGGDCAATRVETLAFPLPILLSLLSEVVTT